MSQTGAGGHWPCAFSREGGGCRRQANLEYSTPWLMPALEMVLRQVLSCLSYTFLDLSRALSLKRASPFPDWSFLPCMCVHECKMSRVCPDGRWAGMVTSRGASATHVAFVKARTVVSNSHGRALSGTPPQQKGQSATPSMQATDTRSVHHDAKFTGIKGLTGTMQTIACLLPATSAYRQLRGVHIA